MIDIESMTRKMEEVKYRLNVSSDLSNPAGTKRYSDGLIEAANECIHILRQDEAVIANNVDTDIESLIAKLKEVESTSTLPDGDVIDVSVALWLQNLIRQHEALIAHHESKESFMDSTKRVYPGADTLPFTIVAIPDEYVCNFVCYEVSGYVRDEVTGEYTVPDYKMAGDGCGDETTEDLDRAQVYLHGGIKWDGCSNWSFDEQERCMLHFCGRRSIRQLTVLFDRLYDLAAELIPKFDPTIGGHPMTQHTKCPEFKPGFWKMRNGNVTEEK